jgi:hypothetical protein
LTCPRRASGTTNASQFVQMMYVQPAYGKSPSSVSLNAGLSPHVVGSRTALSHSSPRAWSIPSDASAGTPSDASLGLSTRRNMRPSLSRAIMSRLSRGAEAAIGASGAGDRLPQPRGDAAAPERDARQRDERQRRGRCGEAQAAG